MITLKDYQEWVLDSLHEFLRLATRMRPRLSFSRRKSALFIAGRSS